MKKTAGIQLILLVFVLAVLSGCKVNHGIPERKMVKILVDMHLADGIVIASDMQYQLADSSAYYGAILKKYGYTREEFRAAVNSYLKSPLEFEKIYEEVIVQLKEMEKEYAPPASTANAPMPEVATDGTTISAEHEGNSLRELHYELSVAGDTLRVYWY